MQYGSFTNLNIKNHISKPKNYIQPPILNNKPIGGGGYSLIFNTLHKRVRFRKKNKYFFEISPFYKQNQHFLITKC